MAFKERLGDRRTALRFEIIGQLWGGLEMVNSTPLRNLAHGGALVELRTPPNPEAFRSIRFGLDGAVHDLQVRICHVTHNGAIDGDRYLVGLQFVEPSAAALEHIDRIIEARLAEMRSVPEA
jgi:hypothetical protein